MENNNLPIAVQAPEPIKKPACNKGSLSFLFASRGQFSQKLSHFHSSLIPCSCLLATVVISAFSTSAHCLLFPHRPRHRFILLAGQFQLLPSTPLFICLFSLYLMPALTLCSMFSKSHSTYTEAFLLFTTCSPLHLVLL